MLNLYKPQGLFGPPVKISLVSVLWPIYFISLIPSAFPQFLSKTNLNIITTSINNASKRLHDKLWNYSQMLLSALSSSSEYQPSMILKTISINNLKTKSF